VGVEPDEGGLVRPPLALLSSVRWSRRRVVLQVAIVLLAVGFGFLAVRNVRFSDAWRALAKSDFWWLVPATAAFGVATLMRALRWRSLFARGRRPPRGPVVAATLIGYLFNNIMPARAGEAARVVALNQRAGTPAAEIVGTVVVERAYDVLSILVIFFCAAPWLPHVSWLGPAAVFAAVLAVVFVVAIWVLAVHGDRPLRFVLRPLARLPRLSVERVDAFSAGLATGLSGLRDRRVAFEAFAWSIGIWLMSSLWAWLILLAFEPRLGFPAGVLVIVAIGLSMIIPSPPAAVGVFEAAALLALKAYGVSQTAALPYALVLHVANFIPLILGGVLTLRIGARRPSRRAPSAAEIELPPDQREALYEEITAR
jgi:glycosyltransferase 2 family protein